MRMLRCGYKCTYSLLWLFLAPLTISIINTNRDCLDNDGYIRPKCHIVIGGDGKVEKMVVVVGGFEDDG